MSRNVAREPWAQDPHDANARAYYVNEQFGAAGTLYSRMAHRGMALQAWPVGWSVTQVRKHLANLFRPGGRLSPAPESPSSPALPADAFASPVQRGNTQGPDFSLSQDRRLRNLVEGALSRTESCAWSQWSQQSEFPGKSAKLLRKRAKHLVPALRSTKRCCVGLGSPRRCSNTKASTRGKWLRLPRDTRMLSFAGIHVKSLPKDLRICPEHGHDTSRVLSVDNAPRAPSTPNTTE